MCGIAGMVGLPKAGTEEMFASMARRGPDGRGRFDDEITTLLHARLAVIDPAGGAQPMEQDGNVLIYNGELYNTQEIRSELLKKGHTFHGRSDTEVVLHAYCEFGEGCVEKFNGIFAFAVWERKRRRLFLARDRIGVKPLFYKLHEGGLLFASQIKTILCYPTVRAELDEIGKAQLLLLGPGRCPGSGVLRDIQELEPGCRGWYENGRFRWERYWRLTDREHRESFPETVERVRFLVTDAIKGQMVSDVPIGTFLSGGLDSSIITAVCAAEHPGPLPTFSVDYENSGEFFVPNKFQPEPDNAYIRTMADFCGTDHHWTVLSPEALADALGEAADARDLPGMADVDTSLLQFCREIRKHVTVALSGECADEIFGGYPWYRDPDVRAREGFPWAQNTAQRASLSHWSLDPEAFVMDAYRDCCRQSHILPESTEEDRRMKEMVNLNFRYFMQTLLDRKDRMSMDCSLEVRVPFCDYRIAEYLYAVPWAIKDYGGQEKGLLRQAAAGLLPETVRLRKKSPYPKTFDPRYERRIASCLARLMADRNAGIWQIVDRSALLALLNAETQWPWYGQLMRKPQTMAYFLQLNWWIEKYDVNFTE